MLPPVKAPPPNPLSARAPATRGLPLRPAGALARPGFKDLLAAACGNAKRSREPGGLTTGVGAPAASVPGAHARSAQSRSGEDAPVGDEPEEKKPRADAIDPLDPSLRSAAQLAPPICAPLAPLTAGGGEQATSRARVSIEELLPLVVRRIAWGGDRTKAAVHVELASGAFAGTTVTVHAEGTRVRVEIGGAGDLDAIRERVEARLRGAGIDVASVT